MTNNQEDLFRKFNVKPEEIFDGSSLIPLPIEWIHSIIENAIENIKNPIPTGKNFHRTERRVVLIFNEQSDAEDFEKRLNMMIPKSINSFIASQDKNPKDYYRALVTQTTINDGVLTISY